jgi:hypothetical protein
MLGPRRRDCKMRLRELPDWPPSPSAPNPNRGDKVPKPNQVFLKSIEPRGGENRVVFTGDFEGDWHTYTYEARHARLAQHIESVLHKHLGKSMTHLGDVEIDEDALIE